MAAAEYAGILPAVALLSGILIYNATNLLLKAYISRFHPAFFQYLSTNRSHRLEPYIAFIMGWLITLFSAPICAAAALKADPQAYVFNASIRPSLLEQICVGSRVVLWIGETPRLEFSSLYTAHHGFSLAAFLGIIHIQAPRQQIYVLYAALATELASTLIAALKIHGWTVKTSRFVKQATYLNVLLLVVVRIPSTLWCVWMISLSGTTDMRVVANVGPLGIYTVYLVYCAQRQAQGLGIWKVEWRAPARVVLFGTYSVSIYALFVGLAWVAYTLSIMWLLSMATDRVLSREEALQITVLTAKIGVAGLIGASGLPLVLGAKKLPRGKRPTCASRGLWFQAGELSIGLALLLSSFGDAQKTHLFLCSTGVTLPLGEAIGRLGCFYGGCCDGRVAKDKRGEDAKLVGSLPLLSTTINFAAYTGLVALLTCRELSIEEAALLALAANGMTRLLTDSLRRDLPRLRYFGGLSPTTLFALCQTIGALVVSSFFERIILV